MYLIVAITVILACCISTVQLQGVNCDIEIMCYGFNAAGDSGYLQINGVQVATWTSATVVRKKRQTNLVDGWHVFSLTSSCAVADSVHLTDTATYLTDFNTFVQSQPQGAWLLGCSAGGADPVDGNTELQSQTLNLFRAMGLDTNNTNSIENFNSGSLLSAQAALIFAIRKGFPEDANWRIIDTTTTGAQTANLVSTNVLQRTITIGWYCGIPPMAGAELYEQFDHSGSAFNARDTYIVTNTPVNSGSSTCALKGWEYIPNAANDAGGPVMKFGFVTRESDGSFTLTGEQEVVSTGSSDHRQFVCKDSNFPAVQDGDMYGVWYDTPGDGESIIRKVYDQPLGVFPYPCGRTATSLDVDTIAHSSISGFAITSGATNEELQSLAVRPIFDDNFVLTCACTSDLNCNAADDAMACINGRCACMQDYSYNRGHNKCIKDADLTTLQSATISMSSVQSGAAENLIDSNKIGSIVDGTCATTQQGLGPWVVIDLNMVADIYAVKITTPSPNSGYVEFIGDSGMRYKLASGASTIAFPAGFGTTSSIRIQGALGWRFYADANYAGDTAVLHSAGTYSAADFGSFGFSIGSLRLLNDLGKIQVKTAGTFENFCLDVSNTNDVILSSGCARSFFFEGNTIMDLTTEQAIVVNGANLELAAVGTDFETENINGDTTTGLDLLDLNDVLDPAKLSVLSVASDCWTATTANSNSLRISSTGNDCLAFIVDPDFAVWEQAWEAKEYSIDGAACPLDDDVFAMSYSSRPCAQILDYQPTGSEPDPNILFVDTDKIEFTNTDGSFTSWCRNHYGRVFYQTSETGIHDFRLGVSDVYDPLATVNENTFSTCATYVGTVQNEKPVLVNCSTVQQGRYIAVYIPDNGNDVEQMLLCDIEIFGKPASTCDDNNGGCEHNCIPGQLLGEIECTCFDDRYVLNADGFHCDDNNECEFANVCDNDVFATCVNEVPGFRCDCDASTDNVIVFDYTSDTCSIPQDQRNIDTSDNLCSYNSGGCSDICVPGANVYEYTCSCDQTVSDRVLMPDGMTCEMLDSCNQTNDCDSDPNGLAICEDLAMGHTCNCEFVERGIGWDAASNKCTTGGTPDTMCTFGSTCGSICESFTLPASETIASPIFNYTCACEAGYRLNVDGINCDDVNECVETAAICDTGVAAGVCTNTVGSYVCSCTTGFTHTQGANGCQDITECDTNNGGCEQSCTNTVGSFECTCASGYTVDGFSCVDIDECATDALNNCDVICVNTLSSFECSCGVGFVRLLAGGRWTCPDIDECATANGGCQTTCTNSVGSFACSCDPGFQLTSGTQCDDINECLEGLAGCDRECTNTVGSFFCMCPEAGRELGDDGTSCIDINECQFPIPPCQDICTNTEGSYLCDCSGTRVLLSDGESCTDNDACASADCKMGCQNVDDGNGVITSQCTCDTGFQLNSDGLGCSDINECSTGAANCEQQCVNTAGSFECGCNAGYTLAADGELCDDVDECASQFTNDCHHNCINQPGLFLCTCFIGYVINANEPNRCNVLVLNMIMILPDSFTTFTGGTSTSLAETIASLRDQIIAILVNVNPGITDITIIVSSGSIIVEVGIEFAEALSDPEAAYEPILIEEALREETFIGANNTVSSTPTMFQVEAVNETTGQQVLVEVDVNDICFLYDAISYCQNGSMCMVDNLPYCLCSEGYTGTQCNVEIISQTGGGVTSDSLTATDVILLSVFITLLVVLTAVIIFYMVYRSRQGKYGSSMYDRRSQSKYAKPRYDDRRSEPQYTTRWWQNLPTAPAAPTPYPRPRLNYQDAARRRTAEDWGPSQSVERETGQERLSRWPAYRAYGISSRFTGSAAGSRYSWRTERY